MAFDLLTGHARALLANMPGWDKVDDKHKKETPERFVKALMEMTTREEFKFTTFPAESDEMVTLGPIPFYTLCAHHVVPFYGKVWIGYVPDELVAGLSKFARAVRYCAKGFHIQENLVQELADFIEERLQPHGCAIVIDAEHMCMAMRGVAQPGVITRTTAMRGVFADHTRTAKAEFMAGVK